MWFNSETNARSNLTYSLPHHKTSTQEVDSHHPIHERHTHVLVSPSSKQVTKKCSNLGSFWRWQYVMCVIVNVYTIDIHLHMPNGWCVWNCNILKCLCCVSDKHSAKTRKTHGKNGDLDTNRPTARYNLFFHSQPQPLEDAKGTKKKGGQLVNSAFLFCPVGPVGPSLPPPQRLDLLANPSSNRHLGPPHVDWKSLLGTWCMGGHLCHVEQKNRWAECSERCVY